MVNLASGNSSTCGSSELNNNSNSFSALQLFPQHHDIAGTQYLQNQPELPVLLPQEGIASTNQGYSSHEMMDIQMPPLHVGQEINLFGDRSTQDPLERFLQGIDQENLGYNPWLNDPSIAWN